jgi:hypothetical protein
MKRPGLPTGASGDFYPYAAALVRAGTIDAVAAPITGADPDVCDVLVALHEELREQAP